MSNIEWRHHNEIGTISSNDSLYYFVLVEFAREMQSTPPCMAAKEPVGLTRLVMCRRRKSFWMARGGACLSWYDYVQNSSRHCMKHDGAFQISCCDGSILLLHCTLWSNVNICLNSCPQRRRIFSIDAMLYLSFRTYTEQIEKTNGTHVNRQAYSNS